jgi:hypothetical protein
MNELNTNEPGWRAATTIDCLVFRYPKSGHQQVASMAKVVIRYMYSLLASILGGKSRQFAYNLCHFH